MLFLPQCFAAYGNGGAKADTAAVVFTDIVQVGLADAAALEAVFALLFCALAGGNDAACELGMSAYLDIKAVFACKQSALFADAAVFGVDFAFTVIA